MRRILIIDDNVPPYVDELRADIKEREGLDPIVRHINPTDYFSAKNNPLESISSFLNEVGKAAVECWDAVAIDLYLGDFRVDHHENLLVCLRVAETFREHNKCATVLLYSGTLGKYISEILGSGASDTHLRRIFHANIANFYPRNRIASELSSAIDNPSWLLRVDLLLMKHASMFVGPEEAEFTGRCIADLATAVRRQDNDGQRITQLTVEHGIAAFIDLNS
jgi:hypothetical protein